MDFFSMYLLTLPQNASSLKFSRHSAHVMALCLTLHVNLGLSLRKTSQALRDLYNISISHQQIADYCKTAAGIDDASYDLTLRVAYYNFLRPHKHSAYNVLNEVEMLQGADNMPGKWQTTKKRLTDILLNCSYIWLINPK